MYPKCPITRTTHGTWVLHVYTVDFIEPLYLIRSSDFVVVCIVVVYPQYPITRTTHETWVLHAYTVDFIESL